MQYVPYAGTAVQLTWVQKFAEVSACQQQWRAGLLCVVLQQCSQQPYSITAGCALAKLIQQHKRPTGGTCQQMGHLQQWEQQRQ
jgi:hypothetical protein